MEPSQFPPLEGYESLCAGLRRKRTSSLVTKKKYKTGFSISPSLEGQSSSAKEAESAFGFQSFTDILAMGKDKSALQDAKRPKTAFEIFKSSIPSADPLEMEKLSAEEKFEAIMLHTFENLRVILEMGNRLKLAGEEIIVLRAQAEAAEKEAADHKVWLEEAEKKIAAGKAEKATAVQKTAKKAREFYSAQLADSFNKICARSWGEALQRAGVNKSSELWTRVLWPRPDLPKPDLLEMFLQEPETRLE